VNRPLQTFHDVSRFSDARYYYPIAERREAPAISA
jgi:hypothetical protein